MNLKDYLQTRRQTVETSLKKYMVQSAGGDLNHHIEALEYSLFAGGKRIRPILCIAAAQSVNADCLIPMRIPCALECIHTYSLIHDDLPAMDDDDLRRGKPTSHKVFGEAGAMLAGDSLLTFAFHLLSADTGGQIPPGAQLRIIHLIAAAAGPTGMVGGQFLDLSAEGKEIPLPALQQIHALKTGALITAAVESGAIIAQADHRQFEALSLYGKKIGLLFQIIDDLLDVVGDPEKTGKPTGSDCHKKKATYPAFCGLEKTREIAAEVENEALAALENFGPSADPLRQLAVYVRSRDK